MTAPANIPLARSCLRLSGYAPERWIGGRNGSGAKENAFHHITLTVRCKMQSADKVICSWVFLTMTLTWMLNAASGVMGKRHDLERLHP